MAEPIQQDGMFREPWLVRELVKANGEMYCRSGLASQNDSQPSRLLVSAGSASSCLQSWELVVGPLEEVVFSSLSGRSVLQCCSPASQYGRALRGSLMQ